MKSFEKLYYLLLFNGDKLQVGIQDPGKTLPAPQYTN